MLQTTSYRVVSKHIECPFAENCVNAAAGECSSIEVISDDPDFESKARQLNLRPKRDYKFKYRETPTDEMVTVLNLCTIAQASTLVIEGVRTLLPDLFVSDPSELAVLVEVRRVATGDIQDPEEIRTDAGLAMLDRVTTEVDQPYSTGKRFLVDESGRLALMPTYDPIVEADG